MNKTSIQIDNVKVFDYTDLNGKGIFINMEYVGINRCSGLYDADVVYIYHGKDDMKLGLFTGDVVMVHDGR